MQSVQTTRPKANKNLDKRIRKYVTVKSTTDPTGNINPDAIIWDEEHCFRVEQVTDFQPAGTVGGRHADCYTVKIKGQSRHLYYERSNDSTKIDSGRWFVVIPAN